MLTPMDIHNKEFGKSIRGFDCDEVNEFLNEVVQAYEILYRENREMTDKVEQMEKRLNQYESTEETMRNTLLAQETGENVKEAARKEADLILQNAEQQRKVILEDANRALREAEARYATIANEMAVFRAKVESILTAQLQLLDGISLQDTTPAEVPTEA